MIVLHFAHQKLKPFNNNLIKKMKKQFTILTILILLIHTSSFGQDKPRFWDEVQTIKNYDKIYKPNTKSILFIGSSSIRKWGHLQQEFGSYNVINRGIGGAVIDEVILYLDDLVFPYQPRQIVIYVGDNDLQHEDETAGIILNKTKKLFNEIRKKLPEVPIVYISIKPSPARIQYQEKCKESNKLIAAFIKEQKNAQFLDVFPLMLNKGELMPELYIEDRLHMNLEGYKIWEKAIRSYLIKN
jgi:lysophospholipase L1-like esterase